MDLVSRGGLTPSQRRPQLVLDLVEGGQAVAGVIVAELVDEARPPVEGHEVRAQRRRQKARGNREVLAARPTEHQVVGREVVARNDHSGRCLHRRCRHLQSPLLSLGRWLPLTSRCAKSVTHRSS